MRSRFLLLAGLSFILSACSLAPQYRRPDAPVPAQWPQSEAYQDIRTVEAPIASELDWRAFFTDPGLQQLIDLALVNNRDLRLAAQNVERARAMYGIQRAELFPAVNAAGGGGKQRRSADLIALGDPRTVEQYNLDLGIASWELDFFGRIRSLKDQALESYLATDEVQRGALITLMNEVAKAYLILAADKENLALAQSTLETQQESYTLIQKSYDIGLATELELRQAQTPVEVARGEIARYKQLVAQDKNALTLLVGTAVPKELLPGDLSSVTQPRQVSAGLNSEVLLQRPDILAAEHQLKAAYAFVGAARAAFFPRISLTTAIGTASDELSGLFGANTNTWNFTPQMSVPIFDARTWAAYRVSKADREIALTRYEKAIQAAFREVADVLAVQETIDQRIEAQRALVNTVAETFRLSEARYKMGIDSYLGTLDAQRSHFAAQQGLVTLQLAKLENRVRLYAVLGGGVSR